MLYWDNDNKISIKVTDLTSGVPVTTATVAVSYYSGRSRQHPDKEPGTLILDSVLLIPDDGLGDGWYSTQLDNTLVPTPGVYVRVVIVSTPGGAHGHWEDLMTVPVRKDTDN